MMKKYYCSECGCTKNRFQIKKVNNFRMVWYECRYCHSSKIYNLNSIIEELATLIDFHKFGGKHGDFL